MNESCHIWKNHVTYAWVISHIPSSDRHLDHKSPHPFLWPFVGIISWGNGYENGVRKPQLHTWRRSTNLVSCSVQFNLIYFEVWLGFGPSFWVPPAEFTIFLLQSSSAGWSQLFQKKVSFSRLKSTFFCKSGLQPSGVSFFCVPVFCTKIANTFCCTILTSAGWSRENLTSACVGTYIWAYLCM